MLDRKLATERPWRNRSAVGAAVVLAAGWALVTSCTEPQICTAIGCSHPLAIQLRAESWVPGEYVVSITESGRTFECTVARGLNGAGGQAGSEGQDETWGVVRYCSQVEGDPTEIWNAPDIYGEEDVTIEVKHAVDHVAVSVRRDMTTLLDTELTPSYTKSYPNGPDCGECLNATETLTLPEEEP